MWDHMLHSHAVAASGVCKQATSDPTLSLCRLLGILPKYLTSVSFVKNMSSFKLLD